MARITGLGGVFFKCADPKALTEWYRDKLGVAVEDWGGVLLNPNDPAGPPHIVWTPFAADTKHFAPSTREFMLNFGVDDLDGYVAGLKAKGVEIIGRDDGDFGKFAWLVDPAGTKIELWEPKRD